jgi:hypothetical protein
MTDARTELMGELSAAERMGTRMPSQRVVHARDHYNAILATATRARDELMFAMHQRAALKTQTRLINAFAWANRELFRAAQAVANAENLPHDGIEHGIKWEVSL